MVMSVDLSAGQNGGSVMRIGAVRFAALLVLCLGFSAPQAAAAGMGGTVNGATVWVPDYYGRSVIVYTYTNPDTLASTKLSVAARSCNPNAVAVQTGLLYVVCNSDFGGIDQILVYDAATNTYVKKIVGKDTGGNDYFTGSSLIGILFDAQGNLWTTGYNSNTLLRVPERDLTTNNPHIDREVIDSPDSPAGLALDKDKSIWIVGQYDGGIVLNFTNAVLNQPGSFLAGNPLNPTPRYCISSSIAGCQPVAGLFNNPEGIAVFRGSVWVSNNGGNAPAATIVHLQKQAGDQLLASTYGGTVNDPFACPGGMISATGPAAIETLWINDEGRNIANTDCGASDADQSANAGLVMEFLGSGLSVARETAPVPQKFTGWNRLKTSIPGFGGIFVQLN
jgi:hypothetical protein